MLGMDKVKFDLSYLNFQYDHYKHAYLPSYE